MTQQTPWLIGVHAHRDGDFETAESQYREVLKQNHEHPGAHFMLGCLSDARGDLDSARVSLERARASAPQWFEPQERLVAVLSKMKRFAEAESTFLALRQQNPDDPRNHRVAARLLEISQNTGAALNAWSTLLKTNHANDDDFLAYGLLNLRLGQKTEALYAFSEAFRRNERNTNAALNLGALYQSLQQNIEAARWYEIAFSLGAREAFLLQFAEAARSAGDFDRWLDLRQHMSQRELNSARGVVYEAQRAQFQGRFDDVAVALSHTVNLVRSEDIADVEEINAISAFFDLNTTQIRGIYDAVDRQFGLPTLVPRPTSLSGTSPARQSHTAPLRVGYVGADFRDHVMGRMALSILEGRDPSSHKAFLYALNATEDALTQQLKKRADAYVRCVNHTDEDVARQIAADKIDVLVDLSGPTAGARIEILARKPAPIAITHVGTANPMGLSAIDFKLTDAICDLPENQNYLIEKLLPMSGCCYPVPRYPLPTTGLTKSQIGLETNVTIGAFFSHMKLSERCVRLWKSVLEQIPNSVLIFSPLDSSANKAYENIMRAVDIAPERYLFLKAGPTLPEQLARYRAIDFVLDSMPYGGVNGTLEALYMGVPVVTLLGTHHSERTSASMLTHLGVTDTIAKTPSEYTQIAKRLAQNPAFRQDVSTRIRARWPKFADPADYARRWEALLRQVAR